MPCLASLLHPLYELLKAEQKLVWSKECEEVFTQAKSQLVEVPVLVHYNPKYPIRLAGDASSYGVGAVLSHMFRDGSEHPIAFASRTLTPHEKNYPQVEKEALSLVFGIRQFHKYVYGRKFTLVTDHQPLTAILGPKAGIPTLAAARPQRWALLLSAYSYFLEFRPTKAHANADGLSRLPLDHEKTLLELSVDRAFSVAQIQWLPVSASTVKNATQRHPLLSRVYRYTNTGWPDNIPDNLKPFFTRRMELSEEGCCLFWGIGVIVPEKLQAAVLALVHEGHVGMVRMKSIARSDVWWPGIDCDLENLGKSCQACLEVQKNPAVAPLHPWVWPSRPWARVHLDFAGPFLGRMFLIAVDTHSKWPEVIE